MYFRWYGMQPFIDPVTKRKVAFAASGDEVCDLSRNPDGTISNSFLLLLLCFSDR